ncbi:MAG: 2-oxoacid:acceptor oxidoreductase family protein, partial [Nitrospirae bacterium]|nr:2-oxoacid:acceptor oxidoreductase family protein [Nitrospirota bacterium]
MDYTIKIGGEAGQGIQTIGDTLAKVFSRSGYHVFTHQDYESRIRGGHNFFQIRFSDKPVAASKDKIDILVALDRKSLELYAGALSGQGQVIYDSSTLTPDSKLPGLAQRSGAGRTPNSVDVPFVRLAVEQGGNKIMSNTV